MYFVSPGEEGFLIQRHLSPAKGEVVSWNLVNYFKISSKRNVKNNQDNFEKPENAYPIKYQGMF